jgi:hypothetical protein
MSGLRIRGRIKPFQRALQRVEGLDDQPCAALTAATATSEWSPAERLDLGPHRNASATRLPVDVQSVLCGAASRPNTSLGRSSCNGALRTRQMPKRLIYREVPVEGLGLSHAYI